MTQLLCKITIKTQFFCLLFFIFSISKSIFCLINVYIKKNFKKVLINRIYTYITSLKKMLKTRKRKNVYIIKKIVKDLNKFVLFLAMYYNFANSINTDIVFSSVNNIFKSTFIDLINIKTDSTNIANKLTIVNKINNNQSLVKIYKL